MLLQLFSDHRMPQIVAFASLNSDTPETAAFANSHFQPKLSLSAFSDFS
jgi:hypothetical protein